MFERGCELKREYIFKCTRLCTEAETHMDTRIYIHVKYGLLQNILDEEINCKVPWISSSIYRQIINKSNSFSVTRNLSKSYLPCTLKPQDSNKCLIYN